MSVRHDISIEYDGKPFSGWWWIDKGMLHVGSPHGPPKSTVARGQAGHEALAQIMLREIAQEAGAR